MILKMIPFIVGIIVGYLVALVFTLIGYFVLGLYPSIIFYFYVIYYPKYGFKVGREPLRELLCIILCGYYAIKFYTIFLICTGVVVDSLPVLFF